MKGRKMADDEDVTCICTTDALTREWNPRHLAESKRVDHTDTSLWPKIQSRRS